MWFKFSKSAKYVIGLQHCKNTVVFATKRRVIIQIKGIGAQPKASAVSIDLDAIGMYIVYTKHENSQYTSYKMLISQ